MFNRVTILLILFHISHPYYVHSSSLREITKNMISDIKKGNVVTYGHPGKEVYDVLNILKGANICHLGLKKYGNIKILVGIKKNESGVIQNSEITKLGLKEKTRNLMPFLKKNKSFSIAKVKEEVKIERKRIYDILSVFQGLGLFKKQSRRVYTLINTQVSLDDQIAQLKSDLESTNMSIKNTINSISSDEGSYTTSVDPNESLTDRSTDFSDEELSNHSEDPYPCAVNGYNLPIEYFNQGEEPIVSASTKVKPNALKFLKQGKDIFSNQKNNDYFWYDKGTNFYYKVDINDIVLYEGNFGFKIDPSEPYSHKIGSHSFYKVNCDESHLQPLNRSHPCSVNFGKSYKKIERAIPSKINDKDRSLLTENGVSMKSAFGNYPTRQSEEICHKLGVENPIVGFNDKIGRDLNNMSNWDALNTQVLPEVDLGSACLKVEEVEEVEEEDDLSRLMRDNPYTQLTNSSYTQNPNDLCLQLKVYPSNENHDVDSFPCTDTLYIN